MPQVQTTQAEEEAKAKARVVVFRTQAVGIVDKAANGEVFLALKSAGMDGQTEAGAPADATKAPGPPPEASPAAALKMPATAKAAMTEALGTALDACAKMAEQLEKAEVDDAAPVPMELVKLAMAAEDALGALVEPYEEALMAAPPPPAPGAPPVEGEAAQKAAPPPPPAEGAKSRKRMALKRIEAMDGVSKALTENAAKVGELVAWAKGAAGMAPPAAAKGLSPATKADIDPYTAMNATACAVRERMYVIRDLLDKDPAAVAAELRGLIPMVDSLAMLVTQARSGAMDQPAPAPAPPPAPAPEEAQMAAQKAFTEAASKVVADMKSELLASLGPLVLSAKGAAASAHAALVRVEKSVPAPQGHSAGEIPTTPSGAPIPADPWSTVQNDIQQARNPAAGK